MNHDLVSGKVIHKNIAIHEWDLDTVPVGEKLLVYWFDNEHKTPSSAKIIILRQNKDEWLDIERATTVQFNKYDPYFGRDVPWNESDFPTHWSYVPSLGNVKKYY
jgi:hypothetical protein